MRFRVLRLLTLAVTFGCGVASAQAPSWPRESPPLPLEAHDAAFPPYDVRTLANGLQVVAVLHHEEPAVSLRLLIRTGSASDPRDKLGLAVLTAALLDQGTTRLNAEAFADEVDYMGAAAGAGAGTDVTFINMILMKDDFGKGLEMLSDMARRPEFAPDEMDRQRQQLLSSLQVNLQDPGYVADAVFDRLVYGAHPYGFPGSGTPETIRRITRDDIMRFHDQYFVPNNAILAIVGDVTADEAFVGAERAFGSWERKALPPASYAEPPSPVERVVIVDKPDAVQTEIRVGQIGIPRSYEDYTAVDLALRILGGEGSNRLYQVLRTQRSLTYGAQAHLDALKTAGDFEAETNTRSEATAEALRLMIDEFWRLRRERVRPRELEGAKSYLTGNFPLAIETPDEIALRVLNTVFYDLPLEELQTFRERIDAVTVFDVQRVARELLHPDKLSVVLVGNADRFVSQLRGLGFGRFEIVALSELDLLSPDFKRASRSGPEAVIRGPRVHPVSQTASAVTSEQPADVDARRLLDRVIAAKGGLDVLRRVHSIRASTESPATGPDGRPVDIVSTTFIAYPNRVRIETTLPDDAQVVQVFDGRHGWVRDPDGVHDVPADRLPDIKAMLVRDPVSVLLAAERGAIRVRRLSDVKDDDGTPEQVLECSGDTLGTVILYVDASTGVLRKQAYHAGPPGTPLTEEHFSDYRDVGGLQVAFAVRVMRAGQVIGERRLTDFTINPPGDPARFARPGP